jgi:TonB family protein
VLAACSRPAPPPPPLVPDREPEPEPENVASPRAIDEGARDVKALVRQWTPSAPLRWALAFEDKSSPLIAEENLLVEASTTRLYTSFVEWLGWVHRRIHPVFAEHFLESLRLEPASSPLHEPTLVTIVHMRVDARDGRLRALRIAKSSGVERFDVGVLDSIDRAQPLPLPPNILRSADGDVYARWAFYRDPMRGCSLTNATPAHF